MKKITTEEFIARARQVHGNRYDYGKTIYRTFNEQLVVTCREHGDFEQIASNHLKGKGCPVCGNMSRSISHKSTKEEFARKAAEVHNGFYNYDKSVYVDAHTSIEIVCPVHGSFMQTPNKHLCGEGCPKCARERTIAASKYTKEDFIGMANEVHNNRYNYDKVDYKGSQIKVTITCPKHGDFEQYPDSHLQGHACPVCGALVSDNELEIYNYLQEHGVNVIHRDRSVLDGKELDIYCPDKCLGIEYNGLYWYSEGKGKDSHYHINKLNLCNEKGLKLIQVYEDEYRQHKSLVIDKIMNSLGMNGDKPKMAGRKCCIREIGKKEAKEFLNANHIQGFDPSTVYVGAFSNEGNELVSVMSFLKIKDKWELTRFATDVRYVCPGLAGKCFKYFVNTYRPSYVKSFADRRWTVSNEVNLYTKLGFTLEEITKPDYYYAFRGKRMHKFNFRKRILNKKYGFPLTMTEREMCDKLKAYKLWNCGLLKYVWKS